MVCINAWIFWPVVALLVVVFAVTAYVIGICSAMIRPPRW